ncbi:hypothetical protein [Isoptericola sp. NPDC056605]|uniref:hypothetical protein n=1 Tax=Isoptericola sp. NPDC056605 TaxID=3345876 RepID=UPI0036BD8F0D
MPLGQTITLRFEGATWGEMRALVARADEHGVPDDAPVDIEYDDDGGRELARVVGIELFIALD